MPYLYKNAYTILRRYYLIVLESNCDDLHYISLMKKKLKVLDDKILREQKEKISNNDYSHVLKKIPFKKSLDFN